MSKKDVFFARLFSSVMLWGFTLWTIFAGWELGFLVLTGVLGMVGLWEFYQALENHRLLAFKYVGLLCGSAILLGSFWFFRVPRPPGSDFAQVAYEFEIAVLAGSILLTFVRQMFQRTLQPLPVEAMAYTIFGIIYVPWLFSFLTKLVYLPPRDLGGHITGHWYVLYLCVVAKFSDMGAYLTGSLIGKHPMVPHISPKKTWEGFGGALIFSTGGSFAMLKLLPDRLGLLTTTDAAVLGLGLGFAAVVGDLAESIVKRSVDAKDSGRFLPGIGGALDLIDSLLFTAPLLFFYMRFVDHVR